MKYGIFLVGLALSATAHADGLKEKMAAQIQRALENYPRAESIFRAGFSKQQLCLSVEVVGQDLALPTEAALDMIDLREVARHLPELADQQQKENEKELGGADKHARILKLLDDTLALIDATTCLRIQVPHWLQDNLSRTNENLKQLHKLLTTAAAGRNFEELPLCTRFRQTYVKNAPKDFDTNREYDRFALSEAKEMWTAAQLIQVDASGDRSKCYVSSLEDFRRKPEGCDANYGGPYLENHQIDQFREIPSADLNAYMNCWRK